MMAKAYLDLTPISLPVCTFVSDIGASMPAHSHRLGKHTNDRYANCNH